MEDEGIVSKKQVFFIVVLILIGLGIFFYYYFNKPEDDISNGGNNQNNNPNNNDTSINENGVYGKFINVDDPYSYLELKEDGTFEFVMNVCEGYLPYTDKNYTLSKNVNKDENNQYSAQIIITAKSVEENTRLTFNSILSDATGLIIEYSGPYSCSPTYNYKRI